MDCVTDEELHERERMLEKQHRKLQHMIIEQQQLSSAVSVPSGFASKPTEEIIHSLENIQRQTRRAAIEVQVEQLQEEQEKDLQLDLAKFTELANSLM